MTQTAIIRTYMHVHHRLENTDITVRNQRGWQRLHTSASSIRRVQCVFTCIWCAEFEDDQLGMRARRFSQVLQDLYTLCIGPVMQYESHEVDCSSGDRLRIKEAMF